MTLQRSNVPSLGIAHSDFGQRRLDQQTGLKYIACLLGGWPGDEGTTVGQQVNQLTVGQQQQAATDAQV